MKSSTVAWFMRVRMGRASIAPPASRRSTRNVERPHQRFWSGPGVPVRASSSMRSECWKREVQIFWPLTRHVPSSWRSARVRMASVLEPASGSVTPKACRRRSPLAMPGR